MGTVAFMYRFKVATPVFGGGVRLDPTSRHRKPIDTTTPVRAASIRGQLRFWWRATHGCTAASIGEMHQREAALWGAASTPGRVSITIVPAEGAGPPRPVEVYDPGKGGRTPHRDMLQVAYAAFPLQPSEKGADKTPGVLHELPGQEFQLSVSAPKDGEAEVRDAVVAWLLFGNVGGRGRRGFGSIEPLDDILGPREFLRRFSGSSSLRLVPSLRGADIALRAQTADAKSAWSVALGRLRDFRQKPGFARNDGSQGRPGRSRWPEPDMIRRVTGTSSQRHKAPTVPMNRDVAPRAAFGMPIITHFKDKNDRDPDQTTLQPEGAERMASPLIIKAVKAGKQWYPVCLRLHVPGASGLTVELVQGKRTLRKVAQQLTPEEAARLEPLRGRTNDVLQAFLQYFEEG